MVSSWVKVILLVVLTIVVAIEVIRILNGRYCLNIRECSESMAERFEEGEYRR